MRITQSTLYNDMLDNLDLVQSNLATYGLEVSSGKQLNLPSDNPQAESQDIGDYADLSTLNQYSSSSQSASATLSIVDSALSDMVNQLTAAQSAAQSAEGSNVTTSQQNAAVATLQSIQQALVSDLGTTVQGTYVFSGTKTTTTPYTISNGTVSSYQGNASTSSVQVGNDLSVPVTLNGQAITQGSDPQDIFTSLSSLITAVQNGDTAGISTGIAALNNAFNRTVAAQTAVGTSLSTLTTTNSNLTSMQTTVQSQISTLEDANMAQAITDYQQAETAEQATIGAVASTGMMPSLMDYLV